MKAGLFLQIVIILSASNLTTQSPQSDQIVTDFSQSTLTDFTGWSFSNWQTGSSMVCGTYLPVFGDFGTYTQVWKTYACPSPHYSAEISLDILKIDNWDTQDHLDILVDSVLVRSLTKSDFQNNIMACWSNSNIDWGDELKTFAIAAPHFGLFLELRLSGYFDEAQSTEAWGVRNIIVAFKLCDSTCASCTGPFSTQCTSCLYPFFLNAGTCVIDCGASSYGDVIDRTCKVCPSGNYLDAAVGLCYSCSSMCKECYQASDRCYQCPSNQLLYDSKTVDGVYYDRCIENKYLTTPHSTYGNLGFYLKEGFNVNDVSSGIAVAILCLSPCLTCSGSQVCLTCPPQMYLFDNGVGITCTNCLFNGYFLKGSYCYKCPSGCNICKNETYCEQCFPGLYLEYSASATGFTGRCITCKSLPDEYPDEKFSTTDGLGVCLKHSECALSIKNCYLCANKYKECSSCKENYLLNRFYGSGQDYCSLCFPDSYMKISMLLSDQITCEKKNLTSGELSKTGDPQIYKLAFTNEPWENYFSNYSQNLKIEISQIQVNEKDCKIEKHETIGNRFTFSLILNKNVTKGDLLKVSLLNIPIETEYSPYTIAAREFFLPMDSLIICPENYTYIKATLTCEPKSVTYINFVLRKTIDPLKYHVIFSLEIPDFFEPALRKSSRGYFPDTSVLSDTLNSNFSLNKKLGKLYELEFQFNQSVMNKPLFYLEIISEDPRIVFTNSQESIFLSDFYYLTEEEKSLLAILGESGRKGTQAIEITTSVNNLLTPGSMFSLKGLVLIQTFQLMRFIEIDYPPNVVVLFEDKLSPFSKDFELEVDNDDGIMEGQYYVYSFSKYILNNSGSYILGGFCYISLGFLGIYIFPRLKTKFEKSKRIAKYISDFETKLRWNLGLSHFLSRYMILVFTVAVNWRFPPLHSLLGLANLIFSAISGAFIFLIPAFIFKKLSLMSKLRRKVVPNDEEFLKKAQSNTNYNVPRKALRGDEGRLLKDSNKKGFEDFELKTEERYSENEQEIKGGGTYFSNADTSFSTPSHQNKMPHRYYKETDSNMNLIEQKFYGNKLQAQSNFTLATETKLDFKPNPGGEVEVESKTNNISEELEKIEESYKAIHEDFKKDNWVSYYFLFCDLLRQIVLSLLILYLDRRPADLLSLIIFINGNFILITLWYKPFKSLTTFLLNFFTEIVLLITCVGAWALAFLLNDFKNSHKLISQEDLDIYLMIGWIMVYAYIVLVYFYLCTQAIGYLVMIKEISKKIYKLLRKYTGKTETS